MGLQEQVIRHLATGQWCSGSDIAAALGVSRAAVWKHVRALPALGLPVSAAAGRGYQLHRALDLLDAREIAAELADGARSALEGLSVVPVTESTSDDLLARPGPGPGNFVARLAEYQTRGRGRRGRPWLAAYGSGLCLSAATAFPRSPRDLPALSLAMGVAVRRALHESGAQRIALKWPNDVVSDAGKVAGILVDVTGESGGPLKAVIGLGVNLDEPPETVRSCAGAGDLPPAGIRFAAGAPPPRNRLAAQLLRAIFGALRRFGESGFQPFLTEWRANDWLSGRTIGVAAGGEPQAGVARGVADDGALCLETAAGMRLIVAGDVSVRPSP